MRPFEVTTPKTTIDLGADGSSSVTFSVSNVSGQPLRANFVIMPDEPQTTSWITIAAPPSFNFSKDAALTQVVVRIAAPAGSAAGTHSFKLRALSAERPDDDFTDSSTIAFAMKGTTKPFPWWIVAVAVVILIVGGGVVALVMNKSQPIATASPTPAPVAGVPVPNLVTETRAQAVAALAASGLTLVETPPAAGPALDTVASQSPAFGAPPVPAGSAIHVTFYGDSAQVPAGLIGTPVTSSTINAFNSVGLHISGVCGVGTIRSTSPPADAWALKSAGVSITLTSCRFIPIFHPFDSKLLLPR